MNINDMENYRRQIAKAKKDKSTKGVDKPVEAPRAKAKKGGK